MSGVSFEDLAPTLLNMNH